jgi:hypothetical protein
METYDPPKHEGVFKISQTRRLAKKTACIRAFYTRCPTIGVF